MNPFRPVVVFALLTPALAWAHLGETYDQCVAQYGPSVGGANQVDPKDKNKGFVSLHLQKDHAISVYYLNDTAVQIAIGRLPSRDKTGVKFTPEEILAFMQAAAPGQTWQPIRETDDSLHWQSARYHTSYDRTKNELGIMTLDLFQKSRPTYGIRLSLPNP